MEGGSAIRSKNGKGKKVPSAEYEVDNFAYDEEKDVIYVPEKQIPKRITKAPVKDSHRRQTYIYRCESEICAICFKKELCTNSGNGRILRVSVNQKKILGYIESLSIEKNKKLIEKRKEIVEHPFGTIKSFSVFFKLETSHFLNS